MTKALFIHSNRKSELSQYVHSRLCQDHEQADRLMLLLVVIHWAVAAVLSPLLYSGFLLGLAGGGLTAFLAYLSYRFYKGTWVARTNMTICLLIFTAIFIQQTYGKIEAHFHFWITLGILTRYKDVRPILVGTAFIIFHHVLLNYCQQIGLSFGNLSVVVYETGPSWYTTALHTFFVLPSGLIFSAIIMQHRQAFFEKENLNENLEEKVAGRTEQLERSNLDLQKTLLELQAAQARLIESEKMASLGRVTAGVAHELKNPLNFIKNFAEISRDYATELDQFLSTPIAGQQAKQLDEARHLVSDICLNAERIMRHGQRADQVVENMMLHAGKKNSKPQIVQINDLLDEYVKYAHRNAYVQMPGLEVTLTREFEDSIGEVHVLPQELGRAFLKVLDNALYAVHEKHLKSSGSDYLPGIRVYSQSIPGAIEIGISDNGIGIPPDKRNSIFEPFFTTKPTGSGLGLGLSISYEIIVHQHGGEFFLEDELRSGHTLFIIRIPT